MWPRIRRVAPIKPYLCDEPSATESNKPFPFGIDILISSRFSVTRRRIRFRITVSNRARQLNGATDQSIRALPVVDSRRVSGGKGSPTMCVSSGDSWMQSFD